MKPFKFLTNHIEDEIRDPSLPSYYDVFGFRCVGVTPTKYDPVTCLPYKYLVYENIQNDNIPYGRMVTGDRIECIHPMFNYNRQIEPDFYNSHYIDRR